MIPRLKELFIKEIKPQLKTKFGYKNGDKVSIKECKPYSKSKKFEVIGVSK